MLWPMNYVALLFSLHNYFDVYTVCVVSLICDLSLSLIPVCSLVCSLKFPQIQYLVSRITICAIFCYFHCATNKTKEFTIIDR